jgi:hypothetical protein
MTQFGLGKAGHQCGRLTLGIDTTQFALGKAGYQCGRLAFRCDRLGVQTGPAFDLGGKSTRAIVRNGFHSRRQIPLDKKLTRRGKSIADDTKQLNYAISV